MKLFFVIAGFAFFLLTLLVEDNKRSPLPVPFGVYLFPIACLFAATFWKSETKDSAYYLHAHEIYGLLANGEMSMDELMETVHAGYHQGDQAAKQLRRTLAKMLDEGTLKISNGKVCLSAGNCSKSAPVS